MTYYLLVLGEKKLFIFACTGSLLLRAGFLWLWWMGDPLVVVHGLLIAGLLLLQSTGYRQGLQRLWHTGLVAPQHVKSFWTRDHVACIGRRILNHWTTGEVLPL